MNFSEQNKISFSEFNGYLQKVKDKGAVFERFCEWFLVHDPLWRTQVKKVWRWNNWPNRWGRDCGIDLVFEHVNGSLWAVQAKCYDTQNSISKRDIDAFLSESNRSQFSGRLLIATTDKISNNARRTCEQQE